VSDMAGKAAKGSGRMLREQPRYNRAPGMSDMAEGWDHELGGVFNGRAQREAAEIQGGSTTDHPLLPFLIFNFLTPNDPLNSGL